MTVPEVDACRPKESKAAKGTVKRQDSSNNRYKDTQKQRDKQTDRQTDNDQRRATRSTRHRQSSDARKQGSGFRPKCDTSLTRAYIQTMSHQCFIATLQPISDAILLTAMYATKHEIFFRTCLKSCHFSQRTKV